MPDYKSQVELAAQGNDSAIWALFSPTVSRVYHTALQFSKNSEDAIHISKDVYAMAFRNIQKLTYANTFPSWIDQLSVYYSMQTIQDIVLSPQDTARLSSFLRDYHKMGDREIQGLLHTTEKIPSSKDSRVWTTDLVPPDVVTIIWSDLMQELHPLEILNEETASSEDSQEELPIIESVNSIPTLADNYLIAKRKRLRLLAVLFSIVFLCLLGSFAFRLKAAFTPEVSPSSAKMNLSDQKVQVLANKISSQISGQISEIYQLTDDTYYVVISLGSSGPAARESMVVKVDQDTGAVQSVPAGKEILTEESIQALADDTFLDISFSTPTTVSWKKVAKSSVDAASKTEVAATNNSLALRADMLSQLKNQGEQQKEKLSNLLSFDESDPFNLILRIQCKNIDFSKPFIMSLDSALASAIGDAGSLQILLNDESHHIDFSSDQLRALCDSYGTVTLQLSTYQKAYEIQYFTSDRELIENLFGSMSFTLPADNPLVSVFATYADGTETRGGAFDSKLQTITFPVSRSGLYELVGDSISISDISTLDSETQNAIQFLVSLRFMGLVSPGSFCPSSTMTRGEFIDVLGRMFFTTNDQDHHEFSDIGNSSTGSEYISSGNASEILHGFQDGTFRADAVITREEALVFCGRTLNHRLNLSPPSSLVLNAFPDEKEISSYAVEDISFALDRGLLSSGEPLRPKDAISRSDCAKILYRMYDCLYHYTY